MGQDLKPDGDKTSITIRLDPDTLRHALAYARETGLTLDGIIERRLQTLRIPRTEQQGIPDGLIQAGTHTIILPDPDRPKHMIHLRLDPRMLPVRESEGNRMIAILIAGSCHYIAHMDEIPVSDIRRFAELLHPVGRNLIKHLGYVEGFRIIGYPNSKSKTIRIEPGFDDTYQSTLRRVLEAGQNSGPSSVNE
ncbi:hypothetical protein [Bifidobacterium sp. SO1]|uniref:hypothetical protein n=1 Tax=Bifidobacterium sp. SO1 TaxID=2809029 RepID=UPI001BDBB297|nr:hypothetical protein [Bifidobacterium sp. SO1]MBT1161750.1 hypothetical protein [Bifidobacterium sp. SO1]